MELHLYLGYEIYLCRQRWEVWSPDGTLLADGVGGLDHARDWVQRQLLRLAYELLLQRH